MTARTTHSPAADANTELHTEQVIRCSGSGWAPMIRLRVIGGWLYRSGGGGLAFVPDRPGRPPNDEVPAL